VRLWSSPASDVVAIGSQQRHEGAAPAVHSVGRLAVQPAQFRYVRAHDLAEVLATLSTHGDDAKILAGGQSLVPLMNLRLSRPSVVIDINRLRGLSHVTRDSRDGSLRIGTLARHRQLEHYPADLEGLEILRVAAKYIGHFAIRDRGTFGGSIAHADASAEWCLVATLLDAQLEVHSTRGVRVLSADEFFKGFLVTSLAPDEMLVEVRLPCRHTHYGIQEFARKHGDFGLITVMVALNLQDGTARDTRIALGGVGPVPLRLPEVERAIDGSMMSTPLLEEAADYAASLVEPPSDIHGTSRYRQGLVRTLLTRAFIQATGQQS
jgi:aerobic carbon-monoxide dehydrogenase medium subunit